jgi:hypothetical protein
MQSSLLAYIDVFWTLMLISVAASATAQDALFREGVCVGTGSLSRIGQVPSAGVATGARNRPRRDELTHNGEMRRQAASSLTVKTDPRLILGRFAQHLATAPHGLDVVLAVRGAGQLLAQLADEDVDDLDLRLVHAAVEIVKKHLLGECRALA